METYGDWLTVSVPKERCQDKTAELKADGWDLKDGCPQDPSNEHKCIITHRRKYEDPFAT